MAAAASRQTGRFRIAATPVWKAAVIFPAIAAFREKLLTLRTGVLRPGPVAAGEGRERPALQRRRSRRGPAGLPAPGAFPRPDRRHRRRRRPSAARGQARDHRPRDMAVHRIRSARSRHPAGSPVPGERKARDDVLGAGTTRPVPHGGPPLARPAAARTAGPAGRAAAQAYRYPVLPPALPIRLCRPALGRGSDGTSSAQADGARNRDRARRKVQRVGRAGLVVRLMEAASLIASDRSHGVELRRFLAAATVQAADSKRSSKISMIAMSRSPASNRPNDGAPADCGSVGFASPVSAG